MANLVKILFTDLRVSSARRWWVSYALATLLVMAVSILRWELGSILGAEAPLLLYIQGAAVDVAQDGLDAIDVALKDRFDVILMDMQMPRLDGYSTTERLRQAGYKGSIIALTAYAAREASDRALRHGCDAYLPKPVENAVLIATVKKFVVHKAPGLIPSP